MKINQTNGHGGDHLLPCLAALAGADVESMIEKLTIIPLGLEGLEIGHGVGTTLRVGGGEQKKKAKEGQIMHHIFHDMKGRALTSNIKDFVDLFSEFLAPIGLVEQVNAAKFRMSELFLQVAGKMPSGQ